ncbi:MAG: HlyD family efflux transporter periplasmic adaptor subunit [Dokdonella sp.]|uniref:efflux RND transporter periplasmic adaptor subunit n=1 Tax=Dokdonella sp. TaxID=2291710 RepID=UPI002D06F9F2|nr:HlyD family efflux transporter periplasmic adaptor subunit [Dokdonella sp.]HOX70872.1 HlyD family efflux transporter periplasmic adaptor subunit [Dokdonella sp.]HPG93854.1 HlyD family efflux transporter periplasmic adaptor subunit [Dokdonella sp.]HPN79655.1 HlyD family efflux transporter periplasmic adaptor subunit [Dokdonella sp.]
MIRDTSAQDRQLKHEPKRGKRWIKFGIGAAALAVLLALVIPTALRLFSSDTSASMSRLRIAEVKRGTLTRDVSVQGSVVAAVSPTLYATSAGTVTLKVNAGDKVSKDQVLAEVVSPELSNRLQQEQATREGLDIEVKRAGLDHRKQQLAAKKLLDQAMIDRQTAKREVERTQRAFDAGAMSEMDLLRTKDALAKADITVANAEADMKLDIESLAFELKSKRLALDRQSLLAEDLQRQVEELKVRSPVDGQVGQLIVQQRANVAANAPILTVVDLSALEIEVKVPEVFAHDLAIGMGAEIRDNAGVYPGEISAVSPQVIDGQVSGRIRFGDSKPAGLRQNQRLTTRILMDEHPNVLMVERGPFVDTGAGRVAYVVRDGVAERTPIEVGATSLNAVEIISGVKEGDRLVISGTDQFNGAQRVAIN